jgi:hypothetical protein
VRVSYPPPSVPRLLNRMTLFGDARVDGGLTLAAEHETSPSPHRRKGIASSDGVFRAGVCACVRVYSTENVCVCAHTHTHTRDCCPFHIRDTGASTSTHLYINIYSVQEKFHASYPYSTVPCSPVQMSGFR